MKKIAHFLSISGLFWFSLTLCSAATYYVNPGESINDAVAKLQPGDTLLVREGVYNEMVVLRVNGTEENRITIKAYDGERVVLDGRELITGWQRCRSKDEIFGNRNYENIFYTKISSRAVSSIHQLTLFEGDYFLQVARDPDQSDATTEDVMEYRPLREESFGLYDGIIDSKFLTQPNGFWNGCHIYIWSHAYNNAIVKFKVANFISNQNKIVFDEPMRHPISKGSNPDAYCLVNHPLVLDRSGEFYLNETPDRDGNLTLYLWPYDASRINENVYRVAEGTHRYGGSIGFFVYGGGSYVTIDGFEIRNFGQGPGTREGGIVCPHGLNHKGLIIRNCLIYDVKGGGIVLSSADNNTIENNIVYNVLDGRGIFIAGGSNHTIRNNFVRNTQSTNICCFGVKDSKIIYNTVSLNGNHGNGITTYLECENVLIAYNKVSEAGACQTLSSSKNITIYNNLYYGVRGGYLIANWGGMSGFIRVLNNTIIESSSSHSLLLGQSDEIICKNNILDGGGSGEMSHNLFTGLAWWQRETSFQEGEFLERDLSKVFNDYDNLNFSIKNDSPAVLAGTDINAYLPTDIFPDFDFNTDIDGNPVDKSGGYNIGAYVSGPVSFELPAHIKRVVYPEPVYGINVAEYTFEEQMHTDTSITALHLRNNIISPKTVQSASIIAVLPSPGELELVIYDSQGRKVKTIYKGHYQNVTFQEEWNARDDDGKRVGSGVYMVHMKAGNYTETKKIVVVR